MFNKVGFKRILLICATSVLFILVSVLVVREVMRQQFLIKTAIQQQSKNDIPSAQSYIDAALWNFSFDTEALKLKQQLENERLQYELLAKSTDDEKDLLIKTLRNELSTLNEAVSKKTTQLGVAWGIIADLRNQLATYSQKMIDAANAQELYKANESAYQKMIDELRSQLAAANKAIETEKNGKAELANFIASSQNDTSDLRDQLTKAQKRIKELMDMIDALNAGNKLTQDGRYQVSYLIESAEDRIAKNDNQGAKRLLDEALQSEPMNPRANMVLASLLLKDNAFTKDSLSRIEFLLKRITVSTGETTEVLQLRGSLYEARNQFAEAETTYSEILKKSGYNEKALTSLMRVLDKEKKWQELLTVSQPYREEKLDHLYIYQARATAFAALGKTPACIEELQIALQLKPGDVGVMAQLAKAFIAEGNYENAVAILKEVVKKDNDYRNWQQLAVCFEALKQPNNAFKAYENAINGNPLTVKSEVLNQIGMCVSASKNRFMAKDKNGTLYYYKKALDYAIATEELKKWGENLAEHDIK